MGERILHIILAPVKGGSIAHGHDVVIEKVEIDGKEKTRTYNTVVEDVPLPVARRAAFGLKQQAEACEMDVQIHEPQEVMDLRPGKRQRS